MLIEEEEKKETQTASSQLDLETMDPLHKAAMLLISLDQQYALSLIHLLKKEEVKEVFNCLDQEMALPIDEMEMLVGDFYEFLMRAE